MGFDRYYNTGNRSTLVGWDVNVNSVMEFLGLSTLQKGFCA